MNTYRRQFFGRTALLGGVLVFPALLSSRKTLASVLRPDQVEPDFWQQRRVIHVRNARSGGRSELCFWDGSYQTQACQEIFHLLADQRDRATQPMALNLFNLIYATQRWFTLATGKSTWTDINSAYRSLERNARVGGAPDSFHLRGAALDGRLEGVSLGVYAAMLNSYAAGGVGLYSQHVHWDVGRPAVLWHGLKN
jgi:uncharacterized protein YcbK (DUF882 family)